MWWEKLKKEDGLTIHYEIGHVHAPGEPRFGGSFSDRPKNTPAASREWYLEQNIGGQPVHLAMLKNQRLLVSYPKQGMNLSMEIKDQQELAEALLMILSYPNPAEKKPAVKQ